MRLTVKLLLLAFLSIFAPGTQAQRPDSRLADFARELIKSDSSAKRSELLAAKAELVTKELGKELVKQGNFLLLAGKYSSAFDVYSLAASVSEQINDSEGLASATLNIGTVYYFQGNYAPALDHYRRAKTLFTSARNQGEAAKALSGMALVLKEQHKEQEALALFGQALKEFESLNDKEEMANTLSSMGAIYYARGEYAEASKAFLKSNELNDGPESVLHIADALYMQGEYSKASDYYQTSLKSFEQERNAAGLISALGGAANSNYYLGKYDEALDYYRRNLNVQTQQRDESGMATSFQGIGNVYRSRGDLISALENYQKSLAVAEHSVVKISTASTIGSIGLVKTMQGEHVQAANYFKESLAQFEDTGDKVGMARMLGHLGNAYHAVGNYESALGSYSESLKLRELMDDQPGQAGLLVGIGTVFLAQKNYPQALASYQNALRLYEAIPNQEATAYVLTRLADTYLLQGDYSQTLLLAERAYSMAKAADNFSTMWYARLVYGKAQRALDQSAQASRSFSEAISIVESLRAEPAAVELGDGRSSLLPYLSQVELLIEQDKPAEAFELSERTRVQALSELLRKTNAKITRGMSAAEQAQERKLAGDVTSIYLQLDRQSQSRNYDEARQTTLRNQLRLARIAYAEFRKRVFLSVPELKVARGQLAPLKMVETQGLVADGQTAILEYVITEDHAYLFALTLDRVASRVRVRSRMTAPGVTLKVYPLAIGAQDLANRISQFQVLLAKRDESFRPEAQALFDFLLKPAKAQLEGKTNLVVVPDGILWRLPFAALQPADGSYVIDSAAVSYVPSLTAWRETRKLHKPQISRGRAAKSLASSLSLSAFGNAVLSPEVSLRLQAEQALGKPETVVPAVAARPAQTTETVDQKPELQSLRSIYGARQSRTFEGREASEDRARVEANRPNGILHFAVPSVLDDSMPMYSAIGLSVTDGQQNDGMLQTWEILSLNSQARLVVLSGADIRGGRLGPGDAVVGFGWGWFVAGIPTVALTRRPIESPAHSQLMSDFHTGVKNHFTSGPKANPISIAEAMRQSMLRLRRSNNYPHPYYWSTFMLIGDAR